MSALHFFAKTSPGRSTNLEASRRHGRQVRARLVNDRIVSDKTFWKATTSRSLFKNCFWSFLMKRYEGFEWFENGRRTPSDRSRSFHLVPCDSHRTRWIQIFLGKE